MSKKSIFVDSTVKPFAFSGTYFKVMQSSHEIDVEFELTDGGFYETGLSMGQGVTFEQKYKNVRISSSTSQQIQVWAGVGQLTQDSQNSTTLAGSTHIETSAITLEVSTAKQAVPIAMGRRNVLILAKSPFYVGSSNVTTANGLPVDGEITLETQGEVWAISERAQELRILEEFN